VSLSILDSNYPQEKYEALLQAKERQSTEAFQEMYGKRAGFEGTISQGVVSHFLKLAHAT
jgi:hypothetical protein